MGEFTAAERLSMLLNYSELSSLNSLSNKLGLSRQNLYDINKGKCGISKYIASVICKNFPNISMDWLLYGTGSMLKDSDANSRPQITAKADHNSQASVSIGNSSEVATLRKRIKELEAQVEELKTEKQQYWEMIQKLMK